MLGLVNGLPSAPALDVLCVMFAAAGCVTAAVALYLAVLSLAARCHRPVSPSGSPTARLLVLIPAHDESEFIGRCVGSLLAQSYPRHLYSVVVVADNCSDDTAAVAAEAGADQVLVRTEPDTRGKGRALRWAIDRLLVAESGAHAFAVVDADSVADRDFLSRLVTPLETGALAAQGESLLYPNASSGSTLRAAAFLLVNRVRPSGRAALGLAATHLAGNGMLLARELLIAKPWGAFTSAEDLEYSLDLQMDGIHIAFARGAILTSPAAPHAQAAAQQQLRWEGGKAYLARTRLPRLIAAAARERRPGLLGVAFDLAVPPLGFLAVGALIGSLVGVVLALVLVVPAWVVAPWLIALFAIPAYVLIGLWAGRAPAVAYAALLRAPLFVLTKPLQARRVLRFRSDTWVRTDRRAEPTAGSEA